MAEYWVVSEGIAGDLVNDLSRGQLTGIKFTVVESATQPSGGVGPYTTPAAAQAEAGTLSGDITAAGNSALPSVVKPASNPLTGLAAIGDFFSRLTQAAVWERVGEVALGLLLIAVGVAKLTHAVPVATKVATAAAIA